MALKYACTDQICLKLFINTLVLKSFLTSEYFRRQSPFWVRWGKAGFYRVLSHTHCIRIYGVVSQESKRLTRFLGVFMHN